MTTNKSADLRERLGLTRAEWARALNVNERTVARWEEEGIDPGPMAADILRAIREALDDGVDTARARRIVSGGIGSMVFAELQRLKTS